MLAVTCPLNEDELLELATGGCDPERAEKLFSHTESCRTCAFLLGEAGRAVAAEAGDPDEPSPWTSGDAFAVGDVVAGRYRIERCLGRGGMGEVYAALDEELNERIALKTIKSELNGQVNVTRRLKREVRLARKVLHPNVCRVLELGRHESEGGVGYFLTMDLIAGETLRSALMRRGKLPLSEVLDIAVQVAKGLEAIHTVGVLHRDVKTDNIMLCTQEGQKPKAVLLDFGVARGDESARLSTQTGALIGTPDYMAPEQLEGAPLGPATDVYALGMVMFELLTGKLPFQGHNLMSRALKRLREAPPSPDKLCPTLSATSCRLVLDCLSRSPSERPPTAAALGERLVAMASELEADVPSEERATVLPADQPFGRARFALVSACAIVAVSLGVWAWKSKVEGTPANVGALASSSVAPSEALAAAPALAAPSVTARQMGQRKSQRSGSGAREPSSGMSGTLAKRPVAKALPELSEGAGTDTRDALKRRSEIAHPPLNARPRQSSKGAKPQRPRLRKKPQMRDTQSKPWVSLPTDQEPEGGGPAPTEALRGSATRPTRNPNDLRNPFGKAGLAPPSPSSK